jgi:hypothetical protein
MQLETANTQLRTLYQRYTPVLNDRPCDTHSYGVNRFCNYIDNRVPEHATFCIYTTKEPIFIIMLTYFYFYYRVYINDIQQYILLHLF